jgi:hypothetical protein
MAKIFHCGGSSGRLGMLRAAIPVSDLSSVLSTDSPKYVGKSFLKMKLSGPSCTVIEVLSDEKHGQWKTGFYRASKGPHEFEDHLRAF